MEKKLSRKSSISLSIKILAVPFLLALISFNFSKYQIDIGFPQFWSTRIQSLSLILSIVIVALPWAFKIWAQHDAKKRNNIDTETLNSMILIVGLSLTTWPSLIGFILLIGGGIITATYLFLAISFAVGLIWFSYSMATYCKKAS